MTTAVSTEGVGDRITPRDRVRTMRMQRHLAVAALACVTGIAILPTAYTLAGFTMLLAVLGLVLGSLARAADARLGQWWGWLYGEPHHASRFDLFVNGAVGRLTGLSVHTPAMRSGDGATDFEPKIRILPLDQDTPP